MKPNEQNLERLIKKLIKNQTIPSSELLFHWEGLEDRGDRVVISTLNKQSGWEVFVLWSESEPLVRAHLKSLSEKAGISEAGVLVLKSSGLSGEDGDSSRSQSLWVLQTVRKGESTDWNFAAQKILAEDDFFEGTLQLLEMEESAYAAHFLTKLLEADPNPVQDQAIRKTLYRLRQKGIEAPREEKVIQQVEASRPEMFLFAQNRLPLWQLFFYYRSSGTKGDWFFAEINEGKSFEILQQQTDIRMNRKGMQQIADQYADNFLRRSGLPINFLFMPAEHARYFLEKSFEQLRGPEDFKKYMGDAPREDPFSDWQLKENVVTKDAESLFHHAYFALWNVEEEFLKGLLDEYKKVAEGPIILPEPQIRQKKAELLDQALTGYYSEEKRRVWAIALEKAAYYLKQSDPEIATIAFSFSRSLMLPDFSIASNAFASFLVERSLAVQEEHMAQQEKEEKKSSLIMSPQEFQRTRKR